MATVLRAVTPTATVEELHNGDHMSQAEFHRIYEQMPPDFRAELIGGIVFVASPLKRQHGTNHLPLGTLLYTYEMYTPGVESGDNTTLLLGEDAEPQPDLYLRILPENGGQSRSSPNDFVVGAPELVAEITHSSQSVDLHGKREDYRKYGVREYLVLSLKEKKLHWFDLAANRQLSPDADGVLRAHTFPGLWIDIEALLTKDRRMIAVLEQGLATAEHAAFASKLAQAKGRKKTSSKTKPARRRKDDRS